MKKANVLATVFAVVMVFSVQALAAAERTFKVAHVFNTDHPVHSGLVKANEMLKTKTNGKFELQIFPAGTYANYKNAIQAVKMGVLDLCPLDTAIDYYEESGVLLSPYTFRDYDHWAKFKQSKVYGELLETIGEKVGVKQLALYTFGFRHTTTKDKKARTPEDFKDLKIRVVNFPPYPEAATVLNAHGSPLPIGDVYMAMASGVADGQENPFTQILTMKFYEVQKYLILTGHMLATSGTIMSKKSWDSLSASEKKIFEEVFSFEADTIDKEVISGEAKLLEELKSKGMEVIEVDKAPFQQRVSLVFKKYPKFQGLYDKIQAIR
jgi:tripartite ATP-independent transporter DctP family solute receptor